MANNDWDVGDTPNLTCDFTNAGALTDPTTITLIVVDPSGNQATYTYALAEITKDATGQYSKTVTVDESGTWQYRWVGTGTVPAADEGEFYVTRSVIE